jgi:hypothetical protein
MEPGFIATKNLPTVLEGDRSRHSRTISAGPVRAKGEAMGPIKMLFTDDALGLSAFRSISRSSWFSARRTNSGAKRSGSRLSETLQRCAIAEAQYKLLLVMPLIAFLSIVAETETDLFSRAVFSIAGLPTPSSGDAVESRFDLSLLREPGKRGKLRALREDLGPPGFQTALDRGTGHRLPRLAVISQTRRRYGTKTQTSAAR